MRKLKTNQDINNTELQDSERIHNEEIPYIFSFKTVKFTKQALIWIIIGWIFLALYNYYFMSFFFLTFEIIGLILILCIASVIQLVKLIIERKNLSRLRILKFSIFIGLLILTFYQSSVNKVIEKIDWKLFYNRRVEIVEKIKNKEINSNTEKPYWKYKLPYTFPVISNGGNEIIINRKNRLNTTTVQFWIFRNFFEAPSTQFIFTNDSSVMETIRKKMIRMPSENWKIEENWYRTYGELY